MVGTDYCIQRSVRLLRSMGYPVQDRNGTSLLFGIAKFDDPTSLDAQRLAECLLAEGVRVVECGREDETSCSVRLAYDPVIDVWTYHINGLHDGLLKTREI